MPLRLLVVASETPDQQEQRRQRSGQASHEAMADALRSLDPALDLDDVNCVTGEWHGMTAERLRDYAGLLFAGSPIQMHEPDPATRSAAAFMRRVFDAGVPSFGSCAGLQIATAAAGGTTKPRDAGVEICFARSVVRAAAGAEHPALRGRPVAWDALAMHSSVVDRQPDGMTVLARTELTPVQVAEVRSGSGWHWGVQYHPELTLDDIADAARSKSDEMIEQGMARDEEAVERFASILETIHRDRSRHDLAWQIGIDDQITDDEMRMRDMRNFLERIAD